MRIVSGCLALHAGLFVAQVQLADAARGACQLDLLEYGLADEVGEELRDSRRKWGCQYSGTECTLEEDPTSGWTTGTCTLLKSSEDGADGERCQPKLLTRELEKDIAKDIAKAKRKFGCSVQAVTCTGSGGVVTCDTQSDQSGEGAAEHRRSAPSAPPGASDACNLGILTASVEYELSGKVGKAQSKFGCPKVSEVSCQVAPSTKWVDCALTLDEEAAAAVPSSCNMDFLAQSVAAEIGEELAEAEIKYGCPVPQTAVCRPSGATRGAIFDCTLEYEETASDDNNNDAPDADAADASASDPSSKAADDSPVTPGGVQWHFRHMRGAHGNL